MTPPSPLLSSVAVQRTGPNPRRTSHPSHDAPGAHRARSILVQCWSHALRRPATRPIAFRRHSKGARRPMRGGYRPPPGPRAPLAGRHSARDPPFVGGCDRPAAPHSPAPCALHCPDPIRRSPSSLAAGLSPNTLTFSPSLVRLADCLTGSSRAQVIPHAPYIPIPTHTNIRWQARLRP